MIRVYSILLNDQGVQYFTVSKQWYGCQCLRFLTCRQMMMHAAAHGGCTDTVESTLEVDSGKKISCRNCDSNPRQYCAWLLSRTLYQLSYPRPNENESSTLTYTAHISPRLQLKSYLCSTPYSLVTHRSPPHPFPQSSSRIIFIIFTEHAAFHHELKLCYTSGH